MPHGETAMNEQWLVRTDDNGVEHVMLKTTDPTLAARELAKYEAMGHKQLYEIRTAPVPGLGQHRRWICNSCVEEEMIESGTKRVFEDIRVITARSADEADALLVLHWRKQCSDGHRTYTIISRTVEVSWY